MNDAISEKVRKRTRTRKDTQSKTNVFQRSEKSESFIVSNSTAYCAILSVITLSSFLSYFDGILPPQVTIRDEIRSPGSFVGERAEIYGRHLSDLGPKVVGSYENEVLAINYLMREISIIQQQSYSKNIIDVDIQKPTGSFYLAFKPYGFRNHYANIQNIVVRLSSGNHSSNSVLINCHYDTVPESPGASDNGMNCAVMLEILRVLSAQIIPLQHNVIFLFNGAEENPLQAAHGFITQHKWSKEVKAVINLDSAGGGSKEVLFQASSFEPWLVEAYARSAPHPFGGVHGEELFQSGIIPSDTDFRVFRDFGGVPGLDLAQYSNGYIYHTRLDRMDYISPGAYQHSGDNILALVKELLACPELEKDTSTQKSKSRVVYFDIFGLYMVVYSETTAVILNLGAVILSCISIVKVFSVLGGEERLQIFRSAAVQFTSWVLSVVIIVFVTEALVTFNASLSWYGHPSYIIALYILPLIISHSVLPLVVSNKSKGKSSPGKMAIRYLNGSQLVWTVVLFVGTVFGIRSSFIVMFFVLFPSVATLITTSLGTPFKVRKYIMNHQISILFPVMFILVQAHRALTLLLPVAGRFGPQSNPELVVGLAVVILYLFVASYTVPLILLLNKPKAVVTVLAVLHVVSMVLVIGTPLGFPYRDDPKAPALQRFYVLHTEGTFHDEKGNVRRSDSGFVVQGLDKNNLNYVSKVMPSLASARSVAADCENELYCGVPVFTSRSFLMASHSHWVPALPPVIHHPTNLEVVSQELLSVSVRRKRILITGPDHITVVFSPRKNVRLLKWSFEEFEPKEGPLWNDRPTYMVYYSHGLVGGTLDFTVDLEVDPSLRGTTSQLMDMAVIGHYLHDRKSRTAEFNTFLSQFPEWAHVTPWTATYKSYIV